MDICRGKSSSDFIDHVTRKINKRKSWSLETLYLAHLILRLESDKSEKLLVDI